MTKSPNPIDIHAGSRVRLRRMMIGMSQERLGEKLNLTFQQVQKYEKGSNRMGASRLFTIAAILDVPVQFFFEDMPADALPDGIDPALSADIEAGGTDDLMGFVASHEGLKLNRAFRNINDPAVRKTLVDHIEALGE